MNENHASAVIYEHSADAVALAVRLLRRKQIVTETDKRIMSDLENVHAGLIHEAAKQRGFRPRLVAANSGPYAYRENVAPGRETIG